MVGKEQGDCGTKKALHSSCLRLARTSHDNCSLPTAALTLHADLTIRHNLYIIFHTGNLALTCCGSSLSFLQSCTLSVRDIVSYKIPNTPNWQDRCVSLRAFQKCIKFYWRLYINKMRCEGKSEAFILLNVKFESL